MTDLDYELDVKVPDESEEEDAVAVESKKPGKRRARKKRKGAGAAKARKKRKQASESSEESDPDDDDDDCDGSGDDQDESGKPRKKGKRKQARGRATVPRKKGGRRQGKTPKAENSSKWQKCSSCKKVKDSKADFNADQNKCKECNNQLRCFNRAVEAQGCADKIKDLAQRDPGTHAKVVKEFVKERKKVMAAGEKMKFNIWEFAVTLMHTEGERLERRGRMMWKSYFLSWAQSDEGGNYSEHQAKQKWKEFEEDKTVTRDCRGPGGHLRLKIPMYDDIIDFKELARKRELKKGERLNSKAMAENKGGGASLRIKMVAGAAEEEDENAVDDLGDARCWKNVQEQMSLNQMDAALALQPSAEELADVAEHAKARRTSGSSWRSRPEPSHEDDSQESSYEGSSDEEGKAGWVQS